MKIGLFWHFTCVFSLANSKAFKPTLLRIFWIYCGRILLGLWQYRYSDLLMEWVTNKNDHALEVSYRGCLVHRGNSSGKSTRIRWNLQPYHFRLWFIVQRKLLAWNIPNVQNKWAFESAYYFTLLSSGKSVGGMWMDSDDSNINCNLQLFKLISAFNWKRMLMII